MPRFPADHAGMALLRNRNFALLFTGQGVSRLGDGLYAAAVAWLAWSLTHAVSAVALVTIAANAPTFVVTLIGASYADRYDRRRLMIGTDLARGALVGVAALLLALGLLHFALLVAIAAVLAAIGAPFAPARDALVARVSPAGALVTANGLLQVSFRSAFFVGPLRRARARPALLPQAATPAVTSAAIPARAATRVQDHISHASRDRRACFRVSATPDPERYRGLPRGPGSTSPSQIPPPRAPVVPPRRQAHRPTATSPRPQPGPVCRRAGRHTAPRVLGRPPASMTGRSRSGHGAAEAF